MEALERSGNHELKAKVAERNGNLDGKTVGRRTEISYKVDSPGETAQHVYAQGSGDTVNDAIA